MSTTIITVLVEGSVCRAASGRYLARSVNAAVGGPKTGTRSYPDEPSLLLPWTWTIDWQQLSGEGISPETPIDAWRTNLEAWVKNRLDSADDQTKRELNSLWATDCGSIPEETDAPDDTDPAWVDEQSWVLLQMQLARMDARISHGLRLCNVVEYTLPDAPDVSLLEIASITVGGRVFKERVWPETFDPKMNSSDTQGYFLADEAYDTVFNIITDSDVEDIEDLSVASPIDWQTRRVDFGKTDASNGDWLADAEEKIEALCDPVLALLKLGVTAEENNQSLTIDADALTGDPQKNDGLWGMLLASPDVLLLPLLAADNTSNVAQVSEWAKATAWLDQLRTSPAMDVAFAKLRDKLRKETKRDAEITVEPFDFAQADKREDLRAFWVPSQIDGREDFAGYLLDAIISAGAAVDISPKVLAWLGRDEASEVLMGRLLPAAVSLGVMRSMAEAAAGETKDREEFEAAFRSSYKRELGELLQKQDGTPHDPVLEDEVVAEVFKRNKGAGDLGVRDGLTVPVEAIFAQPGSFDPHEVLDGYLVAIRQANHPQPGKDAWKVVTRGPVECLEVPSGDTLLVPNPPAIEQGAYNEPPDTSAGTLVYKTERRHALVSYHGLSLLPNADQGDDKPVLSYESIKAPEWLPALAYGGKYDIAVGYQALGGLLPDGFCGAGKPLDLSLSSLEESSTRKLPFMRTMIPGAPDLRLGRPAFGQEAPPLAHAWQAEEDGVRPLWKEIAETGDRWFETARKQARTKFLARAGEGAEVGDTLEFFATPPNLPTLPGGTRPGADAVLRYWRQRDLQWWPTSIFDDGDAKRVPDPAVVGSKVGDGGKMIDSNGGIRIRVYDPASPSSPVHTEDVKLSETDSLTCTIAVGTFSADVDGTNLTLFCPQGESRVLVLTTLVDGDFLQDGKDQRFEDGLLPISDQKGEAGSIALAVEVLPERKHLPHQQQLWNSVTAWRGDDNGLVIALDAKFANPNPGKPLSTEPFKFVGDVVCEWQEWRWDGGPVRIEDVPGDEGDLGLEGAEDASFANFETAYFTNRGSKGAISSTALQLRSPPGDRALPLLTRMGHGNMGATYYRTRLAAISRYDSLAAALPIDPQMPDEHGKPINRSWRGVMLAPKRIDALPTPQISGLIPLGGRVKHAEDPHQVQAGAFALVVDTPWYDTRSGGGLAARMECEVIWEKDGHPAAAAMSEMVNFYGKEKDNTERTHPDPMKIASEDSDRLIKDVGVIGLTQDRGSAVAIYTGSLAFFDALIHEQAIPADYTARLRCRAVLDNSKDFFSDWSQSLLIEFEPTIQGETIAGYYDSTTGTITLKPKDGYGGLITRWQHILDDVGTDNRIMRQGLTAMLFRATTNYIGETVLRVIGASDLERGEAGSGLKLAVKGEEKPTHVRIFETVRHKATKITGNTGMEQLQNLAMQLLPEGSRQPFEPGQALMRVGPLIRLENG